MVSFSKKKRKKQYEIGLALCMFDCETKVRAHQHPIEVCKGSIPPENLEGLRRYQIMIITGEKLPESAGPRLPFPVRRCSFPRFEDCTFFFVGSGTRRKNLYVPSPKSSCPNVFVDYTRRRDVSSRSFLFGCVLLFSYLFFLFIVWPSRASISVKSALSTAMCIPSPCPAHIPVRSELVGRDSI